MVGYGLCKFRENIMRKFLLPILTILILVGCSDSGIAKDSSQSEEQRKYEWRLVTSWPKNYPGLGMAPERIADLVEEMSNGQMKITVYGAGEQVPAFGVFDAVSSGSHQMGHSGGISGKEKFLQLNFLLVCLLD